MSTTLLFLLSFTAALNCAPLENQAHAAYANAANQTPAQLVETADLMRDAGACRLGEGARREAARLHVLEIYLLSRAGAGARHHAAVDAYLETYTPADGQRQHAFVMRHRAVIETTRANMAGALAVLHELLAVTPRTQVGGRVETLLRLGAVQRDMGNYKEAIRHIQQADTLTTRHLVGDERQRQRVRVFIPLMETLLVIYEASPTPEVLAQATRIAEQTLDIASYAAVADQAHVFHVAGHVAMLSGDLAVSEQLLQRAVDTARRSDQFIYVTALRRLANNRVLKGDFGRSITLNEEAYQAAMKQGYFLAARSARQSQAYAAEQAGDGAAAKRYLRDAILLVEDLREEVGTTEWAANSAAAWQVPYRELARILAEDDSLVHAVATLEQSRARHLAALQARLSKISSLDAQEAQQADSMMTRLSSVREMLFTASGVHADSLRMQAARLQSHLSALLGPPPSAQPFDYEALRARLARDDRTVLYYVIDSGDRLFDEPGYVSVFVLRPDTTVRKVLDLRPQELRPRIAQISDVFEAQNSAAASAATAFDLKVLHELYQALVAPVAHLIPPQGALTVVPDEALFALPFAALVTQPVARFAYGQASYLGAEHPIHVELSLSERALSKSTGSGALVVGKSTFERPALPALEGVRHEVRAVKKPLRGSKTLLDREVTRDRFVSEARDSRVIHLATHALLDDTSPLYHALVLTPSGTDDGLLRLHEIERLELYADLVTLSGCNTARGELRAGEGMAGLQYAFRSIGAKSTVSTLWSLSDAAGVDLFGDFYRYLAQGLPKDVALQKAQAAYREQHPSASPFFWAAPVLYGSVAPIEFPAAPSRMGWWLVLVIMLLSFGVLWLVRRFIHPATLPTSA